MTPTSQQKNGEIELARFLAAVVIVCFHADNGGSGCPIPFRYGQIGVEFFFLLSGFLMASSIYRKGNPPCASWNELNRETGRFLWRKLSSFYPELVISCLVAMTISVFVHLSHPMIAVSDCMKTSVAGIFLLEGMGFSGAGLNNASWYLSSMMWGMAILYPLCRRFGMNSILPALSLVILSSYFNARTDVKTDLSLLLNERNIRGFCELACGAALFPFASRLRQFYFRSWLRMLLFFVKTACYGIVLTEAMVGIPYWHGGMGLVLIALISIIVLSFSGVCSDSRLYQHSWIFWLGRFSLPLFLSHIFYAYRFVPGKSSEPYFRFFLYCACAFATALLVMYLSSLVRRFFREHPNFFLKPSTER